MHVMETLINYCNVDWMVIHAQLVIIMKTEEILKRRAEYLKDLYSDEESDTVSENPKSCDIRGQTYLQLVEK